MGQYYTPIIIDSNGHVTTLNNHQFNSGLKLMEHSWIGNEFVNAAYSLIHNNKRRIAWIGDYSDELSDINHEIYTKYISHEQFMRYYKIAWKDDRNHNVNLSALDLKILNHNTKDMYLINHTQKTYIDLYDYIQRCTIKNGYLEGYCANPLPLLTACGNGLGAGDFHEDNIGYKDIGTWAFNYLEYTKNIPNGYLCEKMSFIED